MEKQILDLVEFCKIVKEKKVDCVAIVINHFKDFYITPDMTRAWFINRKAKLYFRSSMFRSYSYDCGSSTLEDEEGEYKPFDVDAEFITRIEKVLAENSIVHQRYGGDTEMTYWVVKRGRPIKNNYWAAFLCMFKKNKVSCYFFTPSS